MFTFFTKLIWWKKDDLIVYRLGTPAMKERDPIEYYRIQFAQSNQDHEDTVRILLETGLYFSLPLTRCPDCKRKIVPQLSECFEGGFLKTPTIIEILHCRPCHNWLGELVIKRKGISKEQYEH